MEAVARGGKKPATYKRTKVLPDALSDGDAENSITNIVHTTGHREKDKEPAWDRLDMFHCAEVFKGIAVMIQVPILHPDVPVRKGIHRNRTVTVLVAKDKVRHSCGSPMPIRMEGMEAAHPSSCHEHQFSVLDSMIV